MKIFLGNSPWNKPGFYGVRAGSRWPHFEKCGTLYMPFPFFLAYSAALLEKNAFDVCLVDGIAEGISLNEFYTRLQNSFSAIVVYEVSTPSIDHDLEIAKETKKRLGENIPIIFCGAHYGMYNKDFLQIHEEIDFVLQGEYEFTLLELVEKLSTMQTKDCAYLYDVNILDNVTGLIFRKPSGEVKINSSRTLEQDLQKFPWPVRHHTTMDKYIDIPGGIPLPSLQMWASRGCPYQCIFCAWPQIMYGGNQYRVRAPKDVVDEMEWCINKYNFKSVYFDDDTFNIGKQRMLKFCEEIKKRNLKIPWAIMARADCMDREILTAMVDAGLVALKYGVESGSQEILNTSGKSLDLKKVRETIRVTKELGIKFHLTFAFGLPGETVETINKTIDTAIDLEPDSLQFSIITPFPGSKYFDILDKKGYIASKNWEEYDGYNRAVIRTDNLTNRDLETALIKANRKWRKHQFFKKLRKQPFSTIKYVLSNPIKNLMNYIS